MRPYSRNVGIDSHSLWQELQSQVQMDIGKGRKMIYGHLVIYHIGQTLEKWSLRSLKLVPSPSTSQGEEQKSEISFGKQGFLNVSPLLAQLCCHY